MSHGKRVVRRKEKEGGFFFSLSALKPKWDGETETEKGRETDICRHLFKTFVSSCQSFSVWIQTILRWVDEEDRRKGRGKKSFRSLSRLTGSYLPLHLLYHYVPLWRSTHTSIMWWEKHCRRGEKKKKKKNTSIPKLIIAFKDLLIEIESPLSLSPKGGKENDFMIRRYPGRQVKLCGFSPS